MSKAEFYTMPTSIGFLYWLDSGNVIKQGPTLWGIGRYRSWLLLDQIQNSNQFIKWLNQNKDDE
jgi:hypothetical protein